VYEIMKLDESKLAARHDYRLISLEAPFSIISISPELPHPPSVSSSSSSSPLLSLPRHRASFDLRPREMPERWRGSDGGDEKLSKREERKEERKRIVLLPGRGREARVERAENR